MIYLLLAIVCSAAMTLFLKGFRPEKTNRYAIILGNYVTCIIVGFLMLKDKAQVLHPAGTTLLYGIIGGILFVFTLVIMQRSIEKNGAILSSAFSRLGLVIPLLMSIALFGEQPKPVQYLGILIVLAAVWIINGQKKDRPASILLLILVLLGSGLADGMAKIFNQLGDRAQDALYILLVFLTAGLITVVLLLKDCKKTGPPGRGRRHSELFFIQPAAEITRVFACVHRLLGLFRRDSIIHYAVQHGGIQRKAWKISADRPGTHRRIPGTVKSIKTAETSYF